MSHPGTGKRRSRLLKREQPGREGPTLTAATIPLRIPRRRRFELSVCVCLYRHPNSSGPVGSTRWPGGPQTSGSVCCLLKYSVGRVPEHYRLFVPYLPFQSNGSETDRTVQLWPVTVDPGSRHPWLMPLKNLAQAGVNAGRRRQRTRQASERRPLSVRDPA